jgi:hypothetical protein
VTSSDNPFGNPDLPFNLNAETARGDPMTNEILGIHHVTAIAGDPPGYAEPIVISRKPKAWNHGRKFFQVL